MVNNKIYIGQTVRGLEERIAEHKRHKKTVMGKAFAKYGMSSFTIEEIDRASSLEELNLKEIEYIKKYNCISPNGYNLCEGGGNTTGYHHRDESKLKMSSAKKGTKTGSDNPFYNKHHAEEQRKSWSKQRRGRTLSKEWRERIGQSAWIKIRNIDTGEVFSSVKEAGKKYNVASTNICKVLKGKRKTCRGCRWEYV